MATWSVEWIAGFGSITGTTESITADDCTVSEGGALVFYNGQPGTPSRKIVRAFGGLHWVFVKLERQ